jgi:hypothetical protein
MCAVYELKEFDEFRQDAEAWMNHRLDEYTADFPDSDRRQVELSLIDAIGRSIGEQGDAIDPQVSDAEELGIYLRDCGNGMRRDTNGHLCPGFRARSDE